MICLGFLDVPWRRRDQVADDEGARKNALTY
jgi:hypothetical protein